jgi:hypothetical protein
MEPASAPGAGGSDEGSDPPGPHDTPAPGLGGWTPGVPSVKELLPSLIFGAALPIAVYFGVRKHVSTDAQGLIIAGSVSVLWILIQFVRKRQVDFVGAIVLVGFAFGVISSTLLGGNAYVLKVRDAFFTALFGVACIVTIYTAKRPAIFYVSRYLSAGNDPSKVAAYNEMHELPIARHTFRVLSVIWGIGLVVEASARLVLAEELHTSTYIAISPFITATIIGSLFAFTLLYSREAQAQAAASMAAGPSPSPLPTPPSTPSAETTAPAAPNAPADPPAANTPPPD